MPDYKTADLIRDILVYKHRVYPCNTKSTVTARKARKEEIEKAKTNLANEMVILLENSIKRGVKDGREKEKAKEGKGSKEKDAT